MTEFSFLGELSLVQMLQLNCTDKMGKWVPKMSENLFILHFIFYFYLDYLFILHYNI